MHQTLHRPASAPSARRLSSQQKNKESKPKTKTPESDGEKELTAREKEEREKVIDNLLERTKTLLGDKEVRNIEEMVSVICAHYFHPGNIWLLVLDNVLIL